MKLIDHSPPSAPFGHPDVAAPLAESAPRIFSGRYAEDMWLAINSARTKRELREALYLVCCRLQELEAIIRSPGRGSEDGS